MTSAKLRILFISLPAQSLNVKNISTYTALGLLLIFCTYYAGISMFAHTHIAGGSSIVHSHLGGGTDHDHSDSQYAVIDILSHFQSESYDCSNDVSSPFFLLSESYTAYVAPSCLNEDLHGLSLRGPPVA